MEISFKKLMLFLLKWWWLFAAVVIVGGLAGFTYASTKEDTYLYTCQIKVQFEGLVASDQSYSSIKEAKMANFLTTVSNGKFLEEQFAKAGASQLVAKDTNKKVSDYVKINRANNSDFVYITCETNSVHYSSSILEEILEGLPDEIERVLPNEGMNFVTTNEPRLADTAVNPKVTSALLGAVVGFVIIAVVLVLARLFDNRIYDEEEISERYKADFLGTIRGNRS